MSIDPLLCTLARVSSPKRIDGREHDFNEEKLSFDEAMWCEAPESIIHEFGCEATTIRALPFPFPLLDSLEDSWDEFDLTKLGTLILLFSRR